MPLKRNSAISARKIKDGVSQRVRNTVTGAVSRFQQVIVGDYASQVLTDLKLFVYGGVLKVEDLDATLGGNLHLHGKKTTPANGDVAANIRAFGQDDEGDDITTGEIYFQYNDVTANPEDPKPTHPGAKLSSIILAVDEEYTTVFPLKVIGNNAMLAAPDGAIGDSSLDNSQLHFYLDESGNNLMVKVKYAAGTVKTGTVCAVA